MDGGDQTIALRWFGVAGRRSRAQEGDALVLARVADGDASALTELYERYARPLFAFLYRLAGDRGTAEEILQDTLLAVWRSAGTYQNRSTVSTWLFGVARRQAHNRLRGLPPPLPAEPPDGTDVVDVLPGPEELAVAATGCRRRWHGCHWHNARSSSSPFSTT